MTLDGKAIAPYLSEMMSSTMTVTAKGQVTLKRDLLAHLGARVGDKLFVKPMPDGSLSLVTTGKGSWDDIAGMLHRPGMKPMSDEELDDAIADAVVEEDQRSRY